MALTYRTALRTAIAQAIITDAGAGAKLKLYNGTKPATLGAVSGGNTLLALLTAGSVLGTATAGAVDFDEANFTQVNSGHAPGTPTFLRVTKSDDTPVLDIDIGVGAGNVQFTGSVATGQNVTATNLAITIGNA